MKLRGEVRTVVRECLSKAQTIERVEELIEDVQASIHREEWRDASAKLVEFQAQVPIIRDFVDDRDIEFFVNRARRADDMVRARAGGIVHDVTPLVDLVRDIRGGLDTTRITIIAQCVIEKG